MLDIAGGTVNYVIYRDGSPDFVHQVLDILRAYNGDTGRQVKLVNTEWLPSCKSKVPFGQPGVPMDFDWGRERITNDYTHTFGFFQVRWFYALNGAARILDYMSYGGEFASANFNNCCNTWGQNIVNASKERAWLSCAGEMFKLFGDYFVEGVPVNYDSGVQGVSVQGLTGAEERFFVVNNTPDPVEVAVDGAWQGEILCAPDQLSRITQEENPVVRRPATAHDSVQVPAWGIAALKR